MQTEQGPGLGNSVWDEVQQWQNRLLEKLYAIVYLYALQVKMRVDRKVDTQAVYIALGVTLDGQKEILASGFRPMRSSGCVC